MLALQAHDFELEPNYGRHQAKNLWGALSRLTIDSVMVLPEVFHIQLHAIHVVLVAKCQDTRGGVVIVLVILERFLKKPKQIHLHWPEVDSGTM